jgi:hypothetical protein
MEACVLFPGGMGSGDYAESNVDCEGATFDVAFPFRPQGPHSEMEFSKLNTQPTDASVYASTNTSRHSPQNSRSGRFAISFLQDSFILDNTPV